MERLFNMNGPYGPLTKLGPLHRRTFDLHHVLEGFDALETVLQIRRECSINIPLPDRRDFETRTQALNQQTGRTPVLQSSKQFNDGDG